MPGCALSTIVEESEDKTTKNDGKASSSSSFESIDLVSQREKRIRAGLYGPPAAYAYNQQPGAVVVAAPLASPVAIPVGAVAVAPVMYHTNWIITAPMLEMPGVPLGLEVLTLVDSIVVQQLIEPLEVLIGFETKNRYILRNVLGQQLYYAMEESNAFTRQFAGKDRGFVMHIIDNFSRDVMLIRRPTDCCGTIATIETPPGNQVGKIVEDYNCGGCCTPSFTVSDFGAHLKYRLIGPTYCSPNEFPLTDYRGGTIGKITKVWSGLAQELFTDADTFGVHFPLNMHPATKAILIGATFIIDFKYFEDNQHF